VTVSDVINALQVYLGSYYVNNFNEFGRTWQVNVQADPRFRDRVQDIELLQVRPPFLSPAPVGQQVTDEAELEAMRRSVARSRSYGRTPRCSSGAAFGLAVKIRPRNRPWKQKTDAWNGGR
jgi:hypothetical protein